MDIHTVTITIKLTSSADNIRNKERLQFVDNESVEHFMFAGVGALHYRDGRKWIWTETSCVNNLKPRDVGIKLLIYRMHFKYYHDEAIPV